MQPITITIPLRLDSAANLREHWRARAKRVKTGRGLACAFVRNQFPFTIGGNVLLTITLTRVAPRPLDTDNLSSAFKAIRDGVADALTVDDGDPRLAWVYQQRRGQPREYGIAIRIEDSKWKSA